MADLSTTYMGVPLKNPLIVAACSISNYVDKVKRAEEVGAGALVIRSLFEEQIHYDQMTMMDFMERAAAISPEVHSSFYPPMESGGPREHLMWVEKTRRAVRIPSDGLGLLADYKDCTGSTNIRDHYYGHAAYTRTNAMLFTMSEIVRSLYPNA